MIKEIKDIRNPEKEQPKEQEKIQLTPEQEADEQLMQDFFDADDEVEEIEFGL